MGNFETRHCRNFANHQIVDVNDCLNRLKSGHHDMRNIGFYSIVFTMFLELYYITVDQTFICSHGISLNRNQIAAVARPICVLKVCEDAKKKSHIHSKLVYLLNAFQTL